MSIPDLPYSVVLWRPPPLFLPSSSTSSHPAESDRRPDTDGNEGVRDEEDEKHGPAIEEEAIDPQLQQTSLPNFVLNKTLHQLLLRPPLIALPSAHSAILLFHPSRHMSSITHFKAPALVPFGFARGSTTQQVVPSSACSAFPPLRETTFPPHLLIEYSEPLGAEVTWKAPPTLEEPMEPEQDQAGQRSEPERELMDVEPASSSSALALLLEPDADLPDSAGHKVNLASTHPAAPQIPKKSQLAESVVRAESSESVDVFTSSWDGEAGKRQMTAASAAGAETWQELDDGMKETEKGGEPEESTQWKVGKTPGHQGSHSRAARRAGGEGGGESEGRKRSLSESIAGAAERVLKKPFRPPTRISLPAARPKASARYDASSPASAATPATSSTLASPDRPTSPTFTDFKSSTQTHRIRSAKLSRPFKTPVRADRSTAPSPSTTSSAGFPFPLNLKPSSSSTPSTPTAYSAQASITSLQNELLVLRKALKYDTEDSRGRLEALIAQWRAAGREVVERLFDLIPQPLDSPFPSTHTASFPISGNSYNPSSFWDDPRASSRLETDEMRELLGHAPCNEDGEPVDEEGVPLVPDVREDDLKRMFEGLRRLSEAERRAEASPSKLSHRPSTTSSSSRRYTSYTSSSTRPSAVEISAETNPEADVNANCNTTWDYGALMRGLGVDPSLLGWDARAEDWADIDT